MKLIFCQQINTKIFYKLIVSLRSCLARHVQSTQNNKFTISLQYLKENVKDEFGLLPTDQRQRFLKIAIIILGLCVQAYSNYPSLLFFCNIFRNNLVVKLIFCMQVSMKSCYKLIVWGWPRIPKVPKIASLQCIYSIPQKS